MPANFWPRSWPRSYPRYGKISASWQDLGLLPRSCSSWQEPCPRTFCWAPLPLSLSLSSLSPPSPSPFTRGCPMSPKYFYVLNPAFLLDVISLLLNYAPNEVSTRVPNSLASPRAHVRSAHVYPPHWPHLEHT